MVWLFQHITLLKKYTGWSKFMISEISFHGLTQMIGIFTFSTFSNWCLDSEDTLNRHFNRLTYIVDRQYYIYIYTHYNFIYIYTYIYIHIYIHIYTHLLVQTIDAQLYVQMIYVFHQPATGGIPAPFSMLQEYPLPVFWELVHGPVGWHQEFLRLNFQGGTGCFSKVSCFRLWL